MKQLLRVYVTDIRVSIVLLFIIFYLLETIPFDPDAIYWLNFQPVIEIGNIKLGQLYISGRSYYLGLGVWLIPSFIYNLYKRRLKEITILLVAFCIPMFIHGTSISYDLVDYKMNIEKYLEPRTEKDKLGWLLLGRDKQVISGIYSKRPIRFECNRAVVEIDNNWDVSISGNDITIIPDTNQHDYKGTSYVYIDTLGKLVIPKVFQSASSFNNYGVAVCKDSFYGMIDTSGKEVLPFDYDEITTERSYGPYHFLERNMQHGLFCDSTRKILLNDCSAMNFLSQNIDSCAFTKHGKDSLFLVLTGKKIPFVEEKEFQFWCGDNNTLDSAMCSLRQSANTIRGIIVNVCDSLAKIQDVTDYLYYDYWGSTYSNIDSYWRNLYAKDSSKILHADLQLENTLYDEWWQYHEYTFSRVHRLQHAGSYDESEALNLHIILRLVYSYWLVFNDQFCVDRNTLQCKQVEFSTWNNSIVNCYNDLLQVQGLSPIATRHIHNEILAWKRLIEYKVGLLKKVKNRNYPLYLKQLLDYELKDFLLVQLEHMQQLDPNVSRYLNERQNNDIDWIVKPWVQWPPLNVKRIE